MFRRWLNYRETLWEKQQLVFMCLPIVLLMRLACRLEYLNHVFVNFNSAEADEIIQGEAFNSLTREAQIFMSVLRAR